MYNVFKYYTCRIALVSSQIVFCYFRDTDFRAAWRAAADILILIFERVKNKREFV